MKRIKCLQCGATVEGFRSFEFIANANDYHKAKGGAYVCGDCFKPKKEKRVAKVDKIAITREVEDNE